MTFRLLVLNGPDRGSIFEMDDGQTLVLGRGESCALRLNDKTVSRVHAEISVSGNEVYVSDKDSTGGTFVNGSKVESASVVAGSKIQIGETTLRLESDEGSTTTVISTPQSQEGVLPELGQELANYRLDEVIGRGASGIVFKAKDTETSQVVALKVLSPSRTSTDENRQRFVRAMKTFLTIKHPNIVELYDAGKTGKFCWAAMEYVDGENLADLIERAGIKGMLDWTEVWRVAMDIVKALNAAYQHQVIHRNVTPRNIIRRRVDETCLLCDFMLAKALQGSLAVDVTQPGQLLGELLYLAPERTRTDTEVDTRSDMYGLGATCYALLTGSPPATGSAVAEIVRNIRETAPERPRAGHMSIDENFEEVVMRMLEKDPARRYQTPKDLYEELVKVGKSANLPLE